MGKLVVFLAWERPPIFNKRTLMWKWPPSIPCTWTLRTWVQLTLAIIFDTYLTHGAKSGQMLQYNKKSRFSSSRQVRKYERSVWPYGSVCVLRIAMTSLQCIHIWAPRKCFHFRIVHDVTMSYRVLKVGCFFFLPVNRDLDVFLYQSK